MQLNLIPLYYALKGASPSSASGAAGASFQAGNTQKLKTSNKYRKHRRANRRAVHRAHKHR